MFERPTHRRPWSELSLLLLIAATVLIAAAVAASVGARQAWTVVAVLAGAYALSRGFARNEWPERSLRPARIRTTPSAAQPAEGVAEVVASEEQLDVDKQSRPHERVRLRREVVTEQVTITVPVRREVLHVERIPIEPGTVLPAEGPRAFAAGETQELILMEEQAVVDKRVVPRERVRLAKEIVTEEQHITETVRREEVDVDRVARPGTEQETAS